MPAHTASLRIKRERVATEKKKITWPSQPGHTWKTVTIVPRTAGSVDSETYSGTTTPAIPTPSPICDQQFERAPVNIPQGSHTDTHTGDEAEEGESRHTLEHIEGADQRQHGRDSIRGKTTVQKLLPL